MVKTLAFLVGASAIALVGIATAPQPAAAGSHVGVDVGPGGVYIGPRHRHYYDEDDYWRRRHHERGAWYEGHRRYPDEGRRRYHDED
jgi:hypothetical protein